MSDIQSKLINPFTVNAPLLYSLKTLVFIALLLWLLPYSQTTVHSLVMPFALAPDAKDVGDKKVSLLLLLKRGNRSNEK